MLNGAKALDALSRTGLTGLFDLPALSEEILNSTTGKARQLRISTQLSAPRVVVGTADGEAKRITVRLPDAQLVKSISPLDDNDGLIPIHLTFTAEASTLEIVMEESAGAIRSLLLKSDLTAIARVIVHHTAIVTATSTSSKQHQIRVALGELGDSGADISRLIEQVSSVIFSGDVTKHAISVRHSKGPHEAVDKERPPSLSMSVEEIATKRRKRKLLEGGDLGYLLDILIQRLHIPKASSPTSIADAAAGNPEEK